MNTELFLARLKSFIFTENLFTPGEVVILAVSGGIDSMLMAWAFWQLQVDFQIAHCNFQLRGEESDGDEDLVRNLARHYNVKFHVSRFDTHEYADTMHISTQMAARELRYAWFEKLRLSESAAVIALAQHAGDLSETILINLIRGTGIAGMHGILARHDFLIRPLLFLTRQDIIAIVASCGIKYREDASNFSTDYTRNKLRINVFPVLREINPSIELTFAENALRMASVERLYKQQIETIKADLLQEMPGGSIQIDIGKLKLLNADARYVLYEILKEYEFTDTIASQIVTGLNSQTGKIFSSPTHTVLKDRSYLLIEGNQTAKNEVITPEFTTLFKIDYPSSFLKTYPENKLIAYFDASFASFPLEIRYWLEGDFFYPMGMMHKKKLSDFFTDNKVPLTEKHRIPIVLHKGQIIWVVGYRIDERFKVTTKTSKILMLTYLSKNQDGGNSIQTKKHPNDL